ETSRRTRVSSVQTTHSYGHPVRRHPRGSPSRRNAQHPRCSRSRWVRPCPRSAGALLLWRCWVRSGGRKAKNCGFPVETRRVNPVYCDDLKMQVEIGGRSKSLHERDSAVLGLVDAVI